MISTRRLSRAWPPARRWCALVVAGAVIGAGCAGANSASRPSRTSKSTPASSAPSTATRTAGRCGNAPVPPPVYDHVIWIWMENHTASDVFGGDAPYTTALARQCGRAAQYTSVGSPSLPNYLGATSGDIHGIHDDASPAEHPLAVDNLFRQVRTAGKAERSYEESMATNCQLDPSGNYAVKHNPAPYYVGGVDRAACQRDDVPLGTVTAGTFRQSLDASTLPAFSFITPNLCSDTHDCSVGTGDQWLQQWLMPILASATYRAGRTVVFVVWDEPTPMPFVVISPTTPPGRVATAPLDHYSLLRTAEELLGLPLLGHAVTASSMRATFDL